uniref:Uncharacterized protein n=1 Tax=Phenylobacterium glaciei TaxID=2803784 RepID=A0A974P5A1_9CAUL|nr:hypothetical protein JKL49_06995 [Phenylobacterium glaciei]
MSDATYIAFVPTAKRDRLRQILQTEDTGPLAWREQRTLFGSEFYFSGPRASPARPRPMSPNGSSPVRRLSGSARPAREPHCKPYPLRPSRA